MVTLQVIVIFILLSISESGPKTIERRRGRLQVKQKNCTSDTNLRSEVLVG